MADKPKMRREVEKDDFHSIVLPPDGSLLGGRWISTGARFALLNKFSQNVIAEISEATPDQVEQAVIIASTAFSRGGPPPVRRAEYLRRSAQLLQERRSQFLGLMVAETGFTIAEVNGDIDRTIVTLGLCAEEATRIIGETVSFSSTPGQHNRLGFTLRVPLGIVCCITPFNSPLNTVAHKVAPALAAGNSVILKPSELTPLTAALFCQLLLDAGVPADFLALLQGSGSGIGKQLVANAAISFYSFTGSTRVGREIQKGAALRRTQMELGSIASTIVFADANLDKALPKIAAASFRKAGQVCTSVQRLYVERAVFKDTVERLSEEAASFQTGDPRNPETRLGPMISIQSAKRAATWIEEARQDQARVLAGGSRNGAILSATVITDVRDGMRVIEEEIFAPCVSVMPFDNFDSAIAHANNTPFGLAAGIFTEDLARGIQAARGMRFGAIHINETSSARSDAMPFGGVKESGFGREGPAYAIRELTEERLVTINGYD